MSRDRLHATLLGDDVPGAELLVVLPGSLLDGSNAMLERLAAKRPLLLVRYGQLRRMDELVDAVAQSVVDHGREAADVIGSSFGGWVAQCLARRRPERVRRLVLSHTFALRPADAPKFRVGLALWSVIPRPLLLALISLRVRRTLAPVRRRSEARYAAALDHVRTALSRAEALDILVAQNQCMLDSLGAAVVPRERGALPRVLILDSSDDPLIPPSARRYLRSQHPDAAVHEFTGSGHVTALAEPDLFADVVERFLDRGPDIRLVERTARLPAG